MRILAIFFMAIYALVASAAPALAVPACPCKMKMSGGACCDVTEADADAAKKQTAKKSADKKCSHEQNGCKVSASAELTGLPFAVSSVKATPPAPDARNEFRLPSQNPGFVTPPPRPAP